MRVLAPALLVIGTAIAAVPAFAQTYAPDYPVCLHVFGAATYFDCRYTSIAQCDMSASGRAAECVTNPYRASAGMDEPPPVHHRRHHYRH
jgi:hypothetical protein